MIGHFDYRGEDPLSSPSFSRLVIAKGLNVLTILSVLDVLIVLRMPLRLGPA